MQIQSLLGKSPMNPSTKVIEKIIEGVGLFTLTIATAIGFHVNSAVAYLINTSGETNIFSTVEVPLNGKNFKFIIDTSLDYSSITPEAANEAGLTPTGASQALFTYGQSILGEVFTGASLLINPLTIPLDFNVANVSLPAGVQGILGNEFFVENNAIIDIDNLLLTINPDVVLEELATGHFVATFTVQGGLGKKKDVKFIVDSGAGWGSTITPELATELLLIPTGKETRVGGAASGNASLVQGTLDDIGTITFAETTPANLPKGFAGLLGRNAVGPINEDEKKATIRNKDNEFRKILDLNFFTVKVPEPTSTLGLLALGTLGAASTLKRQLKPSKSTEKETTKVS
ncbi:pepsin/retropepsin-like aspartic protease family protein [Microcystis aeruginosa]|uniref:pepsin/retropepsin-like aspartic protease family protein n=1 Tax=Microcystis aeruginosa TaxID=1126 RepID=UPI0023307C5A|nr:pepsin/retropepsin-like aspartic protease family protein [Microcystis aeruginosa]MDB9391341.1 pepsin/retropepsin-like aspartic protease family protein [Microcystis aeruginosa CS-579]